jgi:nucleotide-binding universal stress UspA family protein
MKRNTYKILVLSDLKEGTTSTLKNTVSLSKIINADVEFFYVKKPTDIIERESQLSAMRTISKEHIAVEKEIQNLVAPFSKDYNININTSFAFGNVKSEIESIINKTQPDIVVLGKRKQKMLSFIGDSITEFVLNTHKGAVMIASDTFGLEPGAELSLGFFNNQKEPLNLNFTDELIKQTAQPLKSFSIVEKSNKTREKLVSTTNKTVDYVFEKNDNAFKTLSSYLVKNKVNLLCINRGIQSNEQNLLTPEIKDVVNKISVSLLFTNETKLS